MDEIIARAEGDAAYRARVCANLEAALAEAGVGPAAPLLEALRHRLTPGG